MLLSFFRLSGHSMEPTFPSGTLVLVSSIPYFFSRPKLGDIVLFKYKNKMLVKRIKKREENLYFLSGDNKQDSLDSRKLGWIKRNEILGKVISKIS